MDCEDFYFSVDSSVSALCNSLVFLLFSKAPFRHMSAYMMGSSYFYIKVRQSY